MAFRSQAELDEALRVGTVVDASVEAVAGESTRAPAGTDGDEGAAAGEEPTVPSKPIAQPARAKRKSRP
jgi:hypothetical protein